MRIGQYGLWLSCLFAFSFLGVAFLLFVGALIPALPHRAADLSMERDRESKPKKDREFGFHRLFITIEASLMARQLA
jgi:hypothetical protein